MNTELVNKAVQLFTETMELETTDINAEPGKWHDLYSKECELYKLMAKFTKVEGEEYTKRVDAIQKQADVTKLLTEAGLDMNITDISVDDNRIRVVYGYWEEMPAEVFRTATYWSNVDVERVDDDEDCGMLIAYYFK